MEQNPIWNPVQNPAVDEERLKEQISLVQGRVAQAARESGRKPEDITLLAATKTQSAQTINRAIAAGITHIGENRVQELVDKFEQYDKAHCKVHFIGHLQQNKVKYLVDKVDMIQSVDSERLAAEINKQCIKKNRVMDVLVEVNIGREGAKSGVLLEDLEPLLEKISSFERICVRGLMTIPPICENTEQNKHYFSVLNKEFLDIRAKKLDNVNMDFLSMGMSGDYYSAICCGANLVRVGTALFGARN